MGSRDGGAADAPVVVVRTEAGEVVGLGHLRRCLTLADELERCGADVRLLVNDAPGVSAYLDAQGRCAAVTVPGDDADLAFTRAFARRAAAAALVVDSYGVTADALDGLAADLTVAVIDDMGDRRLAVDVVVNGGVHASELVYTAGPSTRLLLGPRYLLLRRAFAAAPARTFGDDVRRVLVTVGGMDPRGVTPPIVTWVRQSLPAATVDAMIGPFFPGPVVRALTELAATDPAVRIHRDSPDFYALMTAADLAVTAGGQTTYELAATGTPAIAIRCADNQTGNLRGLSAAGALDWVGDVREPGLGEAVCAALRRLAASAGERERMSRAARRVVDGLGATRVARAILEECAS